MKKVYMKPEVKFYEMTFKQQILAASDSDTMTFGGECEDDDEAW